MDRTTLRRKPVKVTLAILASLGLLVGGIIGGVAYGSHQSGHVSFTGGGDVSKRVTANSNAWNTTADNTWQSLTGSGLGLTVPSGKVRLITAQFTAESACTGSSWCSVRIVARKAGSSTENELYPRSGTDFAFDTASDDLWESHAINRSIRLGSGSWLIYVQAHTFTDGNLRLDDWHFHYDAHTS